MAKPLTFFDDFKRADEVPMSTNGWTVSNLILSKGVVLTDVVAPGYAIQTTTAPTDSGQSVEADFASRDEGVGKTASVGARLTVNGAEGYLLQLAWEGAGVRKLRLLKFDAYSPTNTRELAVATVTTTTQNSSDLNILQRIRLNVVDIETGVSLKGFINNNNDLSPNISFVDLGNYVGNPTIYNVTHKGPGLFGFFLNDGNIIVESFLGSDHFQTPAVSVGSGRTLAQLRSSVGLLCNRSASSNYADTVLNQFINDAQEQFVNELGDLALFMRVEETMTLAGEEANRRVHLPRSIARVEAIFDATSLQEARFTYRDMTKDGLMSIEFANPPGTSGRSYNVIYFRRNVELVVDTDRTLIPREFDEAVVVGAARRLAEFDSDSRFAMAMGVRWVELVRTARKAMSRVLRMDKTPMRMTIPRRSLGFDRYVSSWQLGSYW